MQEEEFRDIMRVLQGHGHKSDMHALHHADEDAAELAAWIERADVNGNGELDIEILCSIMCEKLEI